MEGGRWTRPQIELRTDWHAERAGGSSAGIFDRPFMVCGGGMGLTLSVQGAVVYCLRCGDGDGGGLWGRAWDAERAGRYLLVIMNL